MSGCPAIGDLTGRTAIVTGAGSGIGLSVSQRFTAAGAQVVGFDRDGRSADVLARSVPGALFVQVDVADRDAVDRAVATALEQVGDIDILVNSAGVRDVGGAVDLPAREWQRVVDVNLTGTYHCCRAAAPGMLARGSGSMVNIASIAGLFGFNLRTAYTVTKHGVVGLTKTLAAQFGPRGVRVNAVCPGLIETPLTAPMVSDPQVRRSFRVVVPLGRAGTPDEIADVTLFLAGAGARSVTGVALPVDGGFSAYATYDITGEPGAFERPVSVLD